jgi:LemA protein
MQRKRYTGYIIGGIFVLLGLFTIVTYNALVKKEESINNKWANVQASYQRRLDLIPSLVNVVKGVSNFEQSTLEKIATARADAMRSLVTTNVTSEGINRQERLQDTMAAAANRVIIAIEKYPTLKGTDAYAGLQTQLEGTERRIKFARNEFNTAVNEYNNKVRAFPSNMLAAIFGFKRKDGFVADAGTDKSVEINFKK